MIYPDLAYSHTDYQRLYSMPVSSQQHLKSTCFPSKKYRIAYIIVFFSILYPFILHASQVEWHHLSLSDNSFTINFSAQAGSVDQTCAFAFSSTPDAHFTSTIHIDPSSSIINTVNPLSSQSGMYKSHYIQWIVFTIPDHKESTPLTGTLTVSFDTPLLRKISAESAQLNHNILIFPFKKDHLAKSEVSTIPAQVPYSRGVRIEIISDGIYKIYGKELQAIGVPISSISQLTYRMFEKDREIPLFFSENSNQKLSEDEYLLFYAKRLRGTKSNFEQFSNTGVYWLFWGTTPGARVALVSGDRRKDPNDYSTGIMIQAQDFTDSLHIEYDNDISWLGNVADLPPAEVTASPDLTNFIDNWYWGSIGQDNLTTFTFNLPSPSPDGMAQLSIGLMGLTSIDTFVNDHHLEIYLNNNPAGSQPIAKWDGQREFVFTSTKFPASSLQKGNNTISFLTQNKGLPDHSALNWISITYPRNHQVLNDNLVFKSNTKETGRVTEYKLTGFSSPDIELWDLDRYRIFSNCIIREGSGKTRGTYTLLFQDSITYPATYYAQQINGRKTPELMTLDTLSNRWDTLAAVDYIAIAPDSFYNELIPLLKMHQKRGLKTSFVSIDQIYNRFSWGIKNPEAIRTFLQYCFTQNPAHPPRYVLLSGDTSHDLDKKNRQLNIIPTHLSRIPGWGPGANDGYFTLVNGDDNFPDLCVGRFPARNRTDLRTMVDKTVKYCTVPSRGFWKDNLLLLGGGESEFTTFNDNVTNVTIGSLINIVRMDAYPNSRFYKDASIASNLIADQINAGVFLLNFNGHGGGNIWSDNNFFGYRDLSRLYNGISGRLPIVMSFTCLTGFFESVSYRSLGEEFLRNSNNGAICFYGASAYTSRNGNLIMNRLILENSLHQSFESIGELINICEMNMLVRYGSQYSNLVQQYNLLGDPALPFEIPPSTMNISLEKNTLSGNDSLVVSGTCAPVENGSLQFLVKAADQEWNRITDAVSGGVFKRSLPVKSGARTASGIVRAYAWNDSAEVRGWVKFSKDTIMVFDISLSPEVPHYGDSILVSCRFATDSSANVYCLYAQTTASQSPSFNGITMRSRGNGLWTTSEKIPIRYTDYTDGKLLLQFRISTQNTSRESEQFSISIAARPDITFTNKNMKLFWSSDSLRTHVEVLNAGNAPVSSFTIVLIWNDLHFLQDTISKYVHNKPLAPGAVVTHSFALPDTQGTIHYTAHLVSNTPEITTQNNSIHGTGYLARSVLKSPLDTLYSRKKGVSIQPATTLQQPHTAFLFTDSIMEPTPLKSSSSWAAITGDSLIMVSAGYRPPLGVNDSLLWIFRTQTNKETDTKSGSLSVMKYDTLLSRWVFLSGKTSPASGLVMCTTSTTGPFASAFIDDSRAPDIEVSVFGRTLDFIDYAAKNKPFSIFLSDPSEILPSSVTMSLNNKIFPSDKHSSIPTNGDLAHISITAYPPVSSALDSITITATDLAGNGTTRTFAYMPGKNLSIEFVACHPNPFSAAIRPDGSMTTIRFAYSITDVARSINLTIYTISGRPIRSWNFSNLIGYQEIEWDGRDRDGYRIANGTYYAKLTVKNKSKKVKKIVKIAKLEGY